MNFKKYIITYYCVLLLLQYFLWTETTVSYECLRGVEHKIATKNVFDTNLESVHFSTAHVVVHSSSKDVHGILDHSGSMEESPTGHLRERDKNKL